MAFLGILLIILGLGLLIESSILIGLIVITIGVICISAAFKKKAEAEQKAAEFQRLMENEEQESLKKYQEQSDKEKAKKKEVARTLWIANRTQELMNQGLLPTDAKTKAETEYILNNKGDA